MEDWYLIKPQPTFNSGFESQDFEDYVADGFDEILTETQLGQDVFLCKGKFDGENFEIETPMKAIIQSETFDAYTQAHIRQMLTYIGVIQDYKYIKYDDQIWLIVTKPSDNQIYEKVVLFLCNYIAKWQDIKGNIVYKPFNIQNASQYNNGEEANKTLILGSDQFMVFTSLDEDTVGLNHEKRMFLDYNTEDPTPYRLTRIDTVSFSYGKCRSMCMIFTEDRINLETDSIEHWLCNYTTPPPVVNPTDIEITYTGQPNSPQIRAGGNAKSFTAVSTNPVTWSVDTTAEQSGYIVLTVDSTDGNKCKVKCLSNESLVGTHFVLKCSDGVDSGEVLITIIGGM